MAFESPNCPTLGFEEYMAWALGVQQLDELNSGTTLLTSILLGVKSV